MLENKKTNNTRQLIGIESIKECCLQTTEGVKIAFIIISPINLNVLSDDIIQSKIKNLSEAVIDIGSLEFLCINSAQSYESNKRFLSHQIMKERNEEVKEIDRYDIEFLDDIQVHMATSREFLIVLRFKPNESLQQVSSALNKSRQILTQNNFSVQIADMASIKRMLAIYFEQNIYEEEMQNFDGERYSSIVEMKK